MIMSYREQSAILTDVQGGLDTRRIPIDRAGIRRLRHPIKVVAPDGAEQATWGLFDLVVDLPHFQRGTHMSRFVKLLGQQWVFSGPAAMKHLARQAAELLEAHHARIETSFWYFLRKEAPVSGVESLLDYEITIIAQSGILQAVDQVATMRVTVPVTSLCPCSKEISQYGAHNQRSHVTIEADCRDEVWVDELIAIAETCASCEVYGLLKRSDEKFVTERAYENPKFVEDMVRDVALALEEHPGVLRYQVESENFESIHNHSAYAMVKRDKTLPRH